MGATGSQARHHDVIGTGLARHLPGDRLRAQRIRSLLFIPVLEQRFISKASERGAHALILDLEDSVAENRKVEARLALSSAVETLRNAGLPLFCRVNNTASCLEQDLEACVGSTADAIMLPKVESAEAVCTVAERLDALERQVASKHAIQIVPLIESPMGMLQAQAIAAAHERVVALGFGADDFASSMGTPPSDPLLTHAAIHVAIAARACGKCCWGLASGITALDDLDDLRRAASQARHLGYTGSPAVHPKQVQIFNDVFRPTSQEMTNARRIVAAYQEASRMGAGACRLDGRMIDKAIVERAYRTLDDADPALP